MCAWENRERGERYYTRSRRVNGRVVREYIGTGPAAELEALRDALERLRRAEEAAAWRAERERLEALETPVMELCESLEVLTRAALVAAGYRRHRRGEWRKKRVKELPEKRGSIGNPQRPVGRPPYGPNVGLDGLGEDERRRIMQGRRERLETFSDLADRAEAGDEAALLDLCEALDDMPGLCWALRDLGREAERALIAANTPDGDAVSTEVYKRQAALMREEIAGPSPTPHERLLAERVVATYLDLRFAETFFARNEVRLTLNQANYYQKRIDRAHRRHMSAIKTLAQVRKLGPKVQINIAEQQIVGGNGAV